MGGQCKARDQFEQELLGLRTCNVELSQANENLQREIERLRKSEEALIDSEELYRTLVQTLPDAVIVTDLDGYITYVSQRATELYGFQVPEELVGRSYFEFIALVSFPLKDNPGASRLWVLPRIRQEVNQLLQHIVNRMEIPLG